MKWNRHVFYAGAELSESLGGVTNLLIDNFFAHFVSESFLDDTYAKIRNIGIRYRCYIVIDANIPLSWIVFVGTGNDRQHERKVIDTPSDWPTMIKRHFDREYPRIGDKPIGWLQPIHA